MDERVSVSVALVLLRQLLPELPLRPGAVLPGRVLDLQGDRGTLLLAGARVRAQLPPGVAAGDALRLRVQHASGERLVLKVLDPAAPGPASAAAPGAPSSAAPATPQAALGLLDPAAAGLLALPGGALARLHVEPDRAPGGGERDEGAPRTVTLRYESPALGRLDVVVSLAPGAVAATVLARAGDAVAAARAGTGELRDGLRAAAGRPAQVSVATRDDAVDLRA
jgi:hypothetical protein